MYYTVVITFGFGPYGLSPGLLSVAIKTINRIAPIKGISDINIIQPLLPISCSLLTATAILGTNVTRLYIIPSVLELSLIAKLIPLKTILMITLKRKKYRYSDLCERQVNVAYFLKTDR